MGSIKYIAESYFSLFNAVTGKSTVTDVACPVFLPDSAAWDSLEVPVACAGAGPRAWGSDHRHNEEAVALSSAGPLPSLIAQEFQPEIPVDGTPCLVTRDLCSSKGICLFPFKNCGSGLYFLEDFQVCRKTEHERTEGSHGSPPPHSAFPCS